MKFNVKYANCKEGLIDYNAGNNFVLQPKEYVLQI